MILILNYGIGNVGSILNMLDHMEIEARVSCSTHEIKKSTHIILPGVGAFKHAMDKFQQKPFAFKETLFEAVFEKKKPLLGICLGMQMLGSESEEAPGCPGLKLIPGVSSLIRPQSDGRFKCPHMGWTRISYKPSCLLFSNFPTNARFYFAHSYKFCPENSNIVTSTFDHGQPITSSIEHENIFGVQFHPEKSHIFGMRLFKNFSKI